MRRVSSHATTSASRRADSTRSVTSSRFPIGVGQTTSRPVTPGRPASRAEQGRAHHPGLVAVMGGHDPHALTHTRQRMRRDHGARRLQDQVAAAHRPTGDHDHLGIEDVHEADEREPEPLADLGHDGDDSGSPPCASSVTIPPSISLPGGEPPAERGVRRALRRQQPLAADRVSGHERLEAANPGAIARAVGAVQRQHRVPELGAQPGCAPVHLAVQPQSAADPGAERHQHRVACPGGGATASLGQHRRVAVVVNHHRQPEPLAHHLAERHPVQRQVVRPARHAGVPVHERGDPESDRLDVRSGRADLLDRLREDVECLLPVRSTPGAVNPVVDHHLVVDHASEELRAPRVDPDDPPRWHGR